jgi:hypothetical protein
LEEERSQKEEGRCKKSEGRSKKERRMDVVRGSIRVKVNVIST